MTANEQDRTQVEWLVTQVQAVTGESVELAYVDQGYTGEQPARAAEAHGIRLQVVKLPETKKRVRFVTSTLGRGTQFRLDHIGISVFKNKPYVICSNAIVLGSAF